MMRSRALLFPAVLVLLVTSLAGRVDGQESPPAAGGSATSAAPPKNDYARADAWLCRPDRQDACVTDLNATVITEGGKMTRESWMRDPGAPVDCFYVYPTVSTDPGPNSDMVPGPEERRVVQQQFARFGSACRLYSPMYRQVTATALLQAMSGKMVPVNWVLGYQDVRDAWRYYLEHDNGGRGVVLIGHSQGSQVLLRLLREEIDGQPAQSRLVSAMLIGTSVAVPKGGDVGGALKQVPLCRSASQTGCVITYSSFRSDVPPPANTLFGRVADPNGEAGCTNPASLAGGSGELRPYFSAELRSSGTEEARRWVALGPPIATPFVTLPALLTAKCVSNRHASYLEVTVHRNPGGPRSDRIPGDVARNGEVQANWGLHLVDVNLAIGNLVDIVRQEARAWTARKPEK